MNQAKKKLTDDVDFSTLLSMRQQGMTNLEIASSCGVSYQTIYKYLGKQDDPRPRIQKSSDAQETPAKEPSMNVISVITTIQGCQCKYVIDTINGNVEINGCILGEVDKKTLCELIDELTYIRKLLK